MSRWICLCLMLVPSLGWASPSHSPIPRLIEAVQAASDPSFAAMLQAHKHRPLLTAPPALRQLLLSQQILRLSCQQGYEHDGSRASLVWWFSEIGVTGQAAGVRESLESALKAGGFSKRGSGDELAFSRFEADGSVSTTVRIRPPRRWVGGSQRACGFDLLWTASDMRKSPAPQLQDVLRDLPQLRDDRIEPALYQELAATTPASLSLGGTWSRYYSWDISWRSGPDPEGVLKKLGYQPRLHPTAPDPGEGETWSRPASGSFAYVVRLSNGNLSLRIQPES